MLTSEIAILFLLGLSDMHNLIFRSKFELIIECILPKKIPYGLKSQKTSSEW